MIKKLLGAIVNAVVSSFLDALRRKRQDEEIKQSARNEVLIEAEKAKNDALEKWEKIKPVNKSDVIGKLREGKF